MPEGNTVARTFTQEQAQAMYEFIKKCSHEEFYKKGYMQERDAIWDAACQIMLKINFPKCPKCNGDGEILIAEGKHDTCPTCEGLGGVLPSAAIGTDTPAVIASEKRYEPEWDVQANIGISRHVINPDDNTRTLCDMKATGKWAVTARTKYCMTCELKLQRAEADRLNGGS